MTLMCLPAQEFVLQHNELVRQLDMPQLQFPLLPRLLLWTPHSQPLLIYPFPPNSVGLSSPTLNRLPPLSFIAFTSAMLSLLILGFLAHNAACRSTPLLQWDPDTVADCAGWYDNAKTLSCAEVRKLYGITPEDFHSWNPSVSLDCEPWSFQSYCIITQGKIDALPNTTTSTTITPTTTSAAATLAPSPSMWEAMGCYAENAEMPILEQNMFPYGDASLSVGKCKNTCYRRDYQFAGVQQGNQCWCGSYVGGEWTRNQTDCNIPCTGDQKSMCGGKGLLNIFKALRNTISTSTKAIASIKVSKTMVPASTTRNVLLG
jgi:hypothetical protein